MKFTDRKEFLYDPVLFKREDTQVALTIHAEYISRHSAVPRPRFFEVSRGEGDIDHLWHMPVQQRTQFSRQLDLPAINVFQKPKWSITKSTITPQRNDQFWLANLHLQQADYFPIRGDMVFWNGYRYMVLDTVMPPENYWQQTGVWLGLYVNCFIVPEGDATPIADLYRPVPAESGGKLLPDP